MPRSCLLGGAELTPDDVMNARVVTDLNAIWHSQHPHSSTSLRTARELRTVAECLDALFSGKLGRLGDILTQRVKALEVAHGGGNWGLAQELEVIPAQSSCLVSERERREAVRSHRLSQRFAPGAARQRLASRSRSP